ncbi:MAG TPA: Type 1 glutamine amidotransferase-like domain-containing protein [Ignavibacteria bacterium]|nr:Type 1 glutamine amidotransferase-like domain-containing protein [Ignavibacteria bacterium]
MLRKIINRVSKNHSGQIIALGGGGFSDSPDNLLLDEYIILQTNKSKPKILFLPTAGGDHPDYTAKFYRTYRKLNCKPSHLELSRKAIPYKKLEQMVMSSDAVFTGGGSPRFLMQVWRKYGLDKIIKRAWKEGIVLSGMSAGAICWYEDGFKNPAPDVWRRIKCLGFLEGSFCPHYDKRGELRKAYRKMISTGELAGGYGVQDGVALHYIGTELKYVVSSVHGSMAFHVRKSGFRVTEKELKPAYLGLLEQVVEEQYEVSEAKEEIEKGSMDVVKEYIKRINEHDVTGIIDMMSADHVFIDSLGINTRGKETMRNAWDTYLTFFPDYLIKPKDFISKNGMVAVFGTASGTLAADGKISPENKFEIPASWTAVVKDGKIAKWRVYADNEPVRKLLEKYKKF